MSDNTERIDELEQRNQELEARVDALNNKLNTVLDEFEDLRNRLDDPTDPTREKWGRDYFECLAYYTEPGNTYSTSRLVGLLTDKDTSVSKEETAKQKVREIAERGLFEPTGTPGVVMRVGDHSE